jgi:hypothetical protein
MTNVKIVHIKLCTDLPEGNTVSKVGKLGYETKKFIMRVFHIFLTVTWPLELPCCQLTCCPSADNHDHSATTRHITIPQPRLCLSTIVCLKKVCMRADSLGGSRLDINVNAYHSVDLAQQTRENIILI